MQSLEPMKITRNKQSGVMVLAPDGRLDIVESPKFEEAVLEVIAGGDTRLVLDMSAVPYVSSSGLRVIVLGAKKASEAGGGFAVSSPQVIVKKVFQAAGMQNLFKTFDALDEAVASLAGGESPR